MNVSKRRRLKGEDLGVLNRLNVPDLHINKKKMVIRSSETTPFANTVVGRYTTTVCASSPWLFVTRILDSICD
jgi:hypothetical protein